MLTESCFSHLTAVKYKPLVDIASYDILTGGMSLRLEGPA